MKKPNQTLHGRLQTTLPREGGAGPLHCGVKQSLTKTLERKNSKQAGRIRSRLRTNLRDRRALLVLFTSGQGFQPALKARSRTSPRPLRSALPSAQLRPLSLLGPVQIGRDGVGVALPDRSQARTPPQTPRRTVRERALTRTKQQAKKTWPDRLRVTSG